MSEPKEVERAKREAEADMVTSNQPTLAGSTIGHFEVISLIGQGGMGAVYRARDTHLGRTVALKLLGPSLLGDTQSHSRFIREARLAATLDHPNICTVFDVGESQGHHFIAMQLVEGQTLRHVIDGRPMPVESLLSIASQIADAMAAAHHQEIIHRDIKPENIIISPAGQIKVLDFGLAMLIEDQGVNLTRSECIVGTPAYMSPEQARGEKADRRSDIFSLGVVLYEMATGRVPFRGASSVETMNAIIAHPHSPVREINGKVPSDLAAIIDRALAKTVTARYQSVDELVSDLRRVATSLTSQPSTSTGSRRVYPVAVAVLLTFVLAAGAWFGWHRLRETQARGQVSRIEELAREKKFTEAHDLAKSVREFIPSDPKLTRLMRTISDTITLTTEPANAKVYLKRYVEGAASESMPTVFAGTTPLSEFEFARGSYILRVEKDGYTPFERSITSFSVGDPNSPAASPPIQISLTLSPTGQTPTNMVYVPGGAYRLVGSRRPTDAQIQLASFHVDKYEVSNQEYKEFVTSGGYLKKEFWKHPFVKEGRVISLENAMLELRDRTGLPGPRGWSNQDYPNGKERHPVTGITWYEAAAYAAFRGKTLPTVFQWEKAARNGVSVALGNIMPWGFLTTITDRANLNSSGTVPSGTFEFGISPFGAHDMAGNVSEWFANETSAGFLIGGASWADPAYLFGNYGPFPPFFSSDRIGFRCVLNATDTTGDQGAFRIQLEDEVPKYTPAAENQVRTWMENYRYDQIPLEASILETTETNEWTREKITFASAGSKRALAYLYLPKHFPRPLQVIHFFPGGDVGNRIRTVPQSVESQYAALVRSGRAVFIVVREGWLERDRPPGFVSPAVDTAEYAELIKFHVTELRRGLDYLGTRPEVSMQQVGFLQASAGGFPLLLSAVETRYRSMALWGAGIDKLSTQARADVNVVNFVPQIRVPILLLHGRYDETAPVKNNLEPLMALIRAPKRLKLFDGGHLPNAEFMIPELNAWFDETIGAVRRN